MDNYFAPLTFLPVVGLLILSTANRYMHVNESLQRHSPDECKSKSEQVKTELRRSHFFRNALVGFYLNIGFFSVAALLVMILKPEHAVLTMKWLSLLGVLSIIYGSSQLILESVLSLKAIKKHISTE